MPTSRPRLSAPCLAFAVALVAAVAACGGGGGGGSTPSTPNNPPPSQDVLFTTFQGASLVIGQPDFTTATGSFSACSETTLYQPYGEPTLAGGTLWVSDYNHSRVLGFAGIPTSNGAAAHLVLGQPDFASYNGSLSATGLRFPQKVVAADGKLLVADYGNNRVSVWSTIPTASGAAADVAVGQAALDVSPTSCTSTSLSAPQSLHVVDGKLLVADSGHHRILVWNHIPTTSGAPADLVIGQPDFTTCFSGTTDAKFVFPVGVWSDGTRIVVADLNNNRVLIWNAFPTTNGKVAGTDGRPGEPAPAGPAPASGCGAALARARCGAPGSEHSPIPRSDPSRARLFPGL